MTSITDSTIQYLIKYTLKRISEAYSSGFELKNRQDALINIFINLNKPNINYKKQILKLDIEK